MREPLRVRSERHRTACAWRLVLHSAVQLRQPRDDGHPRIGRRHPSYMGNSLDRNNAGARDPTRERGLWAGLGVAVAAGAGSNGETDRTHPEPPVGEAHAFPAPAGRRPGPASSRDKREASTSFDTPHCKPTSPHNTFSPGPYRCSPLSTRWYSIPTRRGPSPAAPRHRRAGQILMPSVKQTVEGNLQPSNAILPPGASSRS